MGEGEAFLGLDGQVLVLPDQVTAAEIHWIAPGKLGPGSHRITKVKSFLVLYGFSIHGKGQEAPILHGVVSRALGGGGQGLNGDEVGAAFQALYCAILGDDGAIPEEVVVDEALSLATGFSSSGGFPGFVFLLSLDGEGRQEEILWHKLQVIELPAGVHLVRLGKVGLLRSLFRLFFFRGGRLFRLGFIWSFGGRDYRLLWCCGFVRIICILSIIGGGIFRFRRSDRFGGFSRFCRLVYIVAIRWGLLGGGFCIGIFLFFSGKGLLRGGIILRGRNSVTVFAVLGRSGVFLWNSFLTGRPVLLGRGIHPVLHIGGQGAAVHIFASVAGWGVGSSIFSRSRVWLRRGFWIGGFFRHRLRGFFRHRLRDFFRGRLRGFLGGGFFWNFFRFWVGGLAGFWGLIQGRGIKPQLPVRDFTWGFFRRFGWFFWRFWDFFGMT